MLYDGREYGLFDTEINNFEIIDDKLIVYGIYKMHEKIELIISWLCRWRYVMCSWKSYF